MLILLFACCVVDPEALWEESKVPVLRDPGPTRHPTTHSPAPKETMKTNGKDDEMQRMRGEPERGGRSPVIDFSLHETKSQQHSAEEEYTDERNN